MVLREVPTLEIIIFKTWGSRLDNDYTNFRFASYRCSKYAYGNVGHNGILYQEYISR